MGIKELLYLALALILPFVAIVIAVSPLSSGLHGTTHSEYYNEYRFDGSSPDGAGHFIGDVYIGDNTGWVFCNGKVRFSGELHIVDADFDYFVMGNAGSGSMFDFNYQMIEMNGDGTMIEGLPFFFLGFLGSLVGLTVWLVWCVSKKGPKYDKYIVPLLAIVGTLMVLFLGFSTICFYIFIIIVPIAVVLSRSYSRYSKSQKSWFVGISIGIGIFLMILSTLFIIFPEHYGFGGAYYSKSLALQCVNLGMVGSMSSAGLMGWGIGKITHRKKHPTVHRPSPMPCPQCGGSILPEQSYCPYCGLKLR